MIRVFPKQLPKQRVLISICFVLLAKKNIFPNKMKFRELHFSRVKIPLRGAQSENSGEKAQIGLFKSLSRFLVFYGHHL